MAGEGRALELLLPDVALVLGRAEAAEVGPHPPPLGWSPGPWSTGCAAGALALDVLDPARARPPARQAVGVGDEAPDLRRRGPRSSVGGLPVARSRGRQSPARRRRSRTSSRCLRWLTVAARLSRLCSASLRRSGLRERSDGPSSASSRLRLAVGGGAEDAQVAGADPDPREFVGGADDLAVGLVVDGLALALLGLDDAEVLQLGDQLLAGAGLLDHLLQGQVGARGVDQDRPPGGAVGRLALGVAEDRGRRRRPAPGGSPAAAGTRRAAGAGSSAGARRRSGCRGGSRPRCGAG